MKSVRNWQNTNHIANMMKSVQYLKHSKKFMKMTHIEFNVTEFLMNKLWKIIDKQWDKIFKFRSNLTKHKVANFVKKHLEILKIDKSCEKNWWNSCDKQIFWKILYYHCDHLYVCTNDLHVLSLVWLVLGYYRCENKTYYYYYCVCD